MRSVARKLATTVSVRGIAFTALRNAAALLSSSRWCASTSSTTATAGGAASPVNVEDFTLNMDIVNAHMEASQRWSDLSEKMDAARNSHDYAGLLALADDGLKLLTELGADNAPIQCESMLKLEAAQAHSNLGDFSAATRSATEARRAAGTSDPARLAEIDELLGFFAVKQGNGAEAEACFTALLKWIDQDAKKAMPMVAVAAVNMRRTVLMGLGMAKELKAAADRRQGMDPRGRYDAATTHLIDALNLHLEVGNDPASVKDTLLTLHRCFLGIGDARQAVSTLAKYVGFCERAGDVSSTARGEALLAEVCHAHSLANPVTEARAAREVAEALEAERKAAKEKRDAEQAAETS
jgi:hypothetical protein